MVGLMAPHPATPTDDIPESTRCCLHGSGCEPTVYQAARTAGLDAEGWAYDTALPQQWVDEVRAKTGIYPVGFGIVWAYGPRDSGHWSGGPFALTREASVLLAWAQA